MVDADHAAVGAKGLKAWTEGEPPTVTANALVLLSMKRLLWQVSKEVPLIAVNGVVLGVKLLV